jgi:hypothetical protein
MNFDNCESANDVLVEAVKAMGGSKQVGAMLWPELAIDAAQRKLLDTLNPERPAHLTPEQALFLLVKAREKGCMGAMYAWLRLAGFGPAPVLATQDQAAAALERMRQQMDGLMLQLATLRQGLAVVAAPGATARGCDD